jgi:hypothetical protein
VGLEVGVGGLQVVDDEAEVVPGRGSQVLRLLLWSSPVSGSFLPVVAVLSAVVRRLWASVTATFGARGMADPIVACGGGAN